MSPDESMSEKIRNLPHMAEEYLTVLKKHGLTTPAKLLAAINNTELWNTIHPELKGIGPKHHDEWKAILSAKPLAAEKSAPAVAKPKAQTAPATPKAQVPQRQVVKKPVEPKAAEAAVKPSEVKKVEEKPVAKVEKKPEPVVEKAPEIVKEKPAKADKAEKKPATKKEKKGEKKEAEKEESAEIVEEGGYVPNQKPKLSPEIIDALRKRAKIAETRPEFTRQEYGRRLRLQATGWRKPRGIHSKTRYKMRYRRPMVSIGYAGPKLSKGLHPSGFREVRVFNVNDLSKISDADQQAARIGHGVGGRKREMIIKKADELGIRVLNRR
jgi:large subunit ribosomal protein L32e